ncbi:hypothetical protein L3Q82_005548 [Scortum barcoo]|uniref:Uncharacterized protein n=1 Tax=Scortum barcoo TaxID=214431 RepID=A0ACB8VAX9_9TELE|nr:hypothetical protein L3Q82_005548 [Scortum barcoo]
MVHFPFLSFCNKVKNIITSKDSPVKMLFFNTFTPQRIDMASSSSWLSEDQFLCSICLDVFTDPVTTPCGHNFCKNCIAEHWNTTDQCLCPTCAKPFHIRPELRVNTFISEMVAQFKSAQHEASSSSSEQQESKPGEVPCDVCTGTKLKALKSCLVCLVLLL